MIQANVHQAKSQLSKLIQRAEAGEDVMIARDGKPVVRLQVIAPEDREGPDVAGATWAEWKSMDREIEAQFEAAVNAPEPWLDYREPDPSPEEMARLRELSTEDLVRELIARP